MSLPGGSSLFFLSSTKIHFYFTTFFYWAAIYIYFPILSPYAKLMGGSLKAAGLVMSAYGLPQFIFRIPVGVWSDRIRRRKPFIVVGFLLEGLGVLGLIFSKTVGMLFLSVFIVGVAACMWVPFIILFSSLFPLALIGMSMSIILAIVRLSQVIANISGGWIAEAGGWLAPFYAGAILTAAGFLFSLGIRENRPEESAPFFRNRFRLVFQNPQVLMVSILALGAQFVTFSQVFSFIPIYAQELGASKADLGKLLFTFMVPNILATFLAASLAQKIRDRSVVALGFLIVGAAAVSIPFIETLAILFLLQALNGIGTGFIFPPLTSQAIQPIPPEHQATAMGVFQSVYAIGMTAGPAISGWVGDQFGLAWVFFLGSLLSMIGAFLSWKKIG